MIALALAIALAAAPAPSATTADVTAEAAQITAEASAAQVDATAPWAPADAPTLSEDERRAIADVVEEARSVAPGAGLTLGILHGDRVHRAAWGFAAHAPHRSASVTSSYRTASITKSFTALVAMQLAAEGKLDLDADVRRYVPSFPEKQATITIRHLLSHTSGIAHYRGGDDAMTRVHHTTAQSLALFADRPLTDVPGARFIYSSFGYNLLGAALESATHESFGALLDKRVFAPLDMRSTGLELGGVRGRDDVTGYQLDGERLVKSKRIDISSRFASGGTRSTVDDLLRFSRGLLDGRLVDADTWRTMTTPIVTADGRQADYGLGFAVYPLRGRKVVAHAGGQPETSTLVLLVPEERLAIVLLTNLEGQGTALSALASSLIEILLDGGAPRRELYADDVVDELVLDGIGRIFSHGRAARARDDDAKVARAFAALPSLFSRAQLAARPAESRKALRDAYHPHAGRVSVLVGAEMARVIGSAAMEPLAFFTEYIDACAVKTCVHALPPSLVADVRRFDAARKATPAALLALRPEHVDAHLAELRALAGTPLHVSFVDDLERVAARARRTGRVRDERAALELSLLLHPRSPRVHVALAALDVSDGALDQARERLARAWVLPARALHLDREQLRKRRLSTPAASEAWRTIVTSLPEAATTPATLVDGG